MMNINDFHGSDRFTIRHPLRSGSMWYVYEAYDHERDGVVALKVFPSTPGSCIASLQEEFHALAQISHPNIVSLYDFECGDTSCFITSELVEGISIIDYVRPASRSGEAGSTFDENRLRSVWRQLARAIEALHEKGLVHRDLKPSNVLVTSEARLVIVDFSFLKHVGEKSLQENTELVGTPDYMSPEQAALRLPITTASDWYSAGVMLYEALTGQLPFSGNFFEVMVNKQRSDPPPPIKVTRGVPKDLNELCLLLLQRDPRKRPIGREVLPLLETNSPSRSTAFGR
jgi:eukaryotic-like serine/threonine-protein kinase